MASIFNFQFGSFSESSPSWFDWLSLFVSTASIFLAYYIAKWVYSKEKRDKKKENESLVKSTFQLFKNNLNQLNAAIKAQKNSLEEYQKEKNFKLTFHPDVQVDFLQFIDVKSLYEKVGFSNEEAISNINDLMSNLYRLYDFRQSLRSEVRAYLEKYGFFELRFYSYRQVLYSKYFKLCNRRGKDFIIENNTKKWRFEDTDIFMRGYSALRANTLLDKEIMDESGLKDRGLLNERFLVPLINEITFKFIPEDIDAIEINDVANEAHNAFNDMEYITEKHFLTIESYIQNLEGISAKIETYLA